METKIALLIVALIASFTLMSCDNQSKWNENVTLEFKQKITQDLPVGTSKEAIDQYLTQNNIVHSWVEREKNFRAIVRNVNVKGPVTESIQIIISVDKDSKLSEMKVESIFTAP